MVTLPPFCFEHSIEHFLNAHSGWILDKIRRLSLVPISRLSTSKTVYKKNKEKARKLVHEKLELWNAHYAFTYGRVSIRNSKGRWGSCSAEGNLNFSFNLVFLPEHLVDYLIVHELCHLRELNHSPRFWALVSLCVPDYRKRRMELKSWR